MTTTKTVALILGAGASSRMGEIKALLPWHATTFLGQAVQAARSAGVNAIVVVLGSHSEKIEIAARELNIITVFNEDWNMGMGTSIKCGTQFIKNDFLTADRILIQLVDQPLIDGACLTRLLRFSDVHSERIVAAEYGNAPGAPAVFPSLFFEDLLNIENAAGAKKLIIKNLDATHLVSMAEAAHDVDTPEQYAALKLY